MSTSTNPRTRARSNRLAKLVVSNDPPLEGELQTFRDSIMRTQIRLSDVDEEIAQIRASLDSLLLVRGQLQARIQDLEVVTTPIRRVPADILSVIFDFCVHRLDIRGFSGLNHDSLNIQEGIWVLGQVCHRWRSIVEELAGLWSSVNVSLYTNGQLEIDRSIGHSHHLLERLLRNTKNAPLSVGLYGLEMLPHALPLLHAISKHSERWENFRVLLPDRRIPQSLRHLSDIRGRLGSLESLHIFSEGIYPDETNNELCDTFSLAPRLRKLVVTQIANPNRSFSLPWSQITQYSWSARSAASNDHFSVIQHMPNLEECELSCNLRSGEQGFTLRPTIQLLSLRMLDLREESRAGVLKGVSYVLSWLQAPALQRLAIRGQFDHTGCVALREFLIRSGPLSTLYLGYRERGQMTHQELIEILRCVPSLKNLYLDDVPDSFAAGLFGALRRRTDIHPPPLPVSPNLQTLVLRRLRSSNFDAELFLQMIESRWIGFGDDDLMQGARQVSRLRTVTLSWQQEIPVFFLDDARLNKLRAEGLQVECDTLSEFDGM